MAIRLSVVGAGYLGQIHIKKLVENNLAEFVGFYEIDPQRKAYIESEYGVSGFSSVDELVRVSDAVIISSPTKTHFEYAKRFILDGLDVFVEKPLADSSRRALELAELAEKNRVVLQVGHIERFNPAYVYARGYINCPIFIEAHRMSLFKQRGIDVGVVFDLMVHDLDLVLDLMGEKPVSIFASSMPIVTQHEDIVNARLEFSGGRIANLTASRVSLKSMRKMRIFEPNSYYSIDFEKKEVELVSNALPACGQYEEFQLTDNIKFYRTVYKASDVDPIMEELSHFIDCVKTRARPRVSGFEAVHAISLAEKIIEVSSRWRQSSL